MAELFSDNGRYFFGGALVLGICIVTELFGMHWYCAFGSIACVGVVVIPSMKRKTND